MPFICTKCLEVYNKVFDQDGHPGTKCPKMSCDSNIAEIDEDLVEIIIELNRKGYLTKMCCQGHPHDVTINTFIAFYNEECFPPITPKGFDREAQNGYYIFRKTYRKTTEYIELQKQIMTSIFDLLAWVQGLPPNTKIIEGFKKLDRLNAN